MAEHPVHIPDLPSEEGIDRLVALLDPLARVTQPKVYGVEHIPDDGALLVGNHTIYGFLDLPFMMAEIWKRRRMTVRGLGEHAHYAIPVWRDVLAMCGMVRGTRDNVRALMRDRQNVLVFPGGAREVNPPPLTAPTDRASDLEGDFSLGWGHGHSSSLPGGQVRRGGLVAPQANKRTPGDAKRAAIVERARAAALLSGPDPRRRRATLQRTHSHECRHDRAGICLGTLADLSG